MAIYEISPANGVGARLARPVELVCIALVVAHAVCLAAFFVQGSWPDGSAQASDFVNVWAAGRTAFMGHAAVAYDLPAHKLAEESAVGHPFDGVYGWQYPPTFLFVAIALSLLPYSVAFVTWAGVTFLAYVAAIRAIIGDRIGYMLAAAFPAVLGNFLVGQNGFFSAGLFGGTLFFLERRPVLAGVLLGLLTYKPHLGLLFPIALAAGGYWRVFVTAGLVAALMSAASWFAFGDASWQAFIPSIGHASQSFLSEGSTDFGKLQTAFGLTRTLGGGENLAWTVQIAMALIAAVATALVWRSRATFEIKAATLGIGAMLATPYLYIYDSVVLAVPLAFLFRLGGTRGFWEHEGAGIGLACLLLLIFPFVKAPVGFAAMLVVAVLIARRALKPLRPFHSSEEEGPG
jgi:arabinofuranan 3-O-arabinosyltransferase